MKSVHNTLTIPHLHKQYPELLPSALPCVTSRPRSKREGESAQTHAHHRQATSTNSTAVVPSTLAKSGAQTDLWGSMNINAGADQGSSSAATPDTNTNNAGDGVVDAEEDTAEGTPGSNEQQESNVDASGSTGGVRVISPKPVYNSIY